jgi:Tol biopolymer transport system component
MRVDGEDAHEVLPWNENLDYQSVAWSPDGKAMVFIRAGDPGGGVQGILGISDLTGAPPTVLVSSPQLASDQCFSTAAWLPQGRILFTRTEAAPNEGSANFWELRIDPRKHTQLEEPTRLTRWADSCVTGVDAPPDGSHLAFLKTRRQSDVYLGELRDDGDRLENVRRLTLDDRDDFGAVWTPDSRAIYFASNRHGTFDIFKQRIDEQTAEAVVQGPGSERKPRLSPDGASLLYEARPVAPDSAPARLMRMPIAGGTPEVVLQQDEIAGFKCPMVPTASCVLIKSHERDLSFFHFDPKSGVGSEIGRIDTSSTAWSLSPDGSRIALIGDGLGGGAAHNGTLSMNVSDGAISDLHVDGVDAPDSLAWSSDGRSLFMTDFVTDTPSPARRVVHADLAGHVRVLWQSRIVWGHVFDPLPSPDGRYLAFGVESFESNAWMLENF